MRRLLVVALACGGAPKATETAHADFPCHDRSATYVIAGAMGGAEMGVQLDCKAGPRIKRWRADNKGARQEDARALTADEFERVWTQLAGTGWENMKKTCTNGSGKKDDPLYQFDIMDDQNTASFSCQARSMPYPYDGIVNPLDALAAQGKGQLGDDEPAELKALDKKKPK